MASKIVDRSEFGDANFCAGIRIILDGADISHSCYAAEVYEDGTGTAWCWKQRNGSPYFDEATQDIASEVLTGKVEILRP